MTRRSQLQCLTCILVLAAACRASPTPVPTRSASLRPPTAGPTSTAVPSPSATATPSTTSTSSPSATATITPVAPANRVVELALKGTGQPFAVTVTEQQVSELVFQTARKDIEASYHRVEVKIAPDKMTITAFVQMEAADAGVTVVGEGVPVIVDGQMRFQLNKITIEDRHAQLTQFLTQVVVNTLNKSLYLLQPTQQSDLTWFNFRATRIELHAGDMLIEGVLN